MGGFLRGDARSALAAAIEAVEARTAAEVVVAVRPRSASYLFAGLVAGAVAAFGTLAFTLYSDWVFAFIWILLYPLFVGALIGVVVSRTWWLLRLLTPRSVRQAWTRTAAEATFYRKRIHRTRGRTGLLVYVSLLERCAEVVVDSAVEERCDTKALAAAIARIDDAVARGEDGAAVAKHVEALGDVLEPALPRAEEDVDELPNEVIE